MNRKILVVLGEGGHTKEMLTLVDMMEMNFIYGYLLAHDDAISENKIRKKGQVFRVVRPRDKKLHRIKDIFKTLRCTWESLQVLRRFRPDAVLSSGPSIAVPVSVLSRLLGRRVIFVETASRVTSLSLSGKILYRIAHLFFVQWPELRIGYPKALYRGRLL